MKRRAHISVTIFHAEPSLWFRGRRVIPNPEPPCCTHRTCRTLRTARRVARGILDRWPAAEVVILRTYFTPQGSRMSSEHWVKHPGPGSFQGLE